MILCTFTSTWKLFFACTAKLDTQIDWISRCYATSVSRLPELSFFCHSRVDMWYRLDLDELNYATRANEISRLQILANPWVECYWILNSGARKNAPKGFQSRIGLLSKFNSSFLQFQIWLNPLLSSILRRFCAFYVLDGILWQCLLYIFVFVIFWTSYE